MSDCHWPDSRRRACTAAAPADPNSSATASQSRPDRAKDSVHEVCLQSCGEDVTMRSCQSDPKPSRLSLPLVILATAVLNGPASIRASEPRPAVAATPTRGSCPTVELTTRFSSSTPDPTWDVTIDVDFTSPSTAPVPAVFLQLLPLKPTSPRARAISWAAVWPCRTGGSLASPGPSTSWAAWPSPFHVPLARRPRSANPAAISGGRGNCRKGSSGSISNPFRGRVRRRSPTSPGVQGGVFDSNANGSLPRRRGDRAAVRLGRGAARDAAGRALVCGGRR